MDCLKINYELRAVLYSGALALFSRLFSRQRSAIRGVRGKAGGRKLRLETLEGRSMLAPLADIVDATPDPRNAVVSSAEIRFTDETTGAPTPVTGVDIADFELTLDSTPVSLTGLTVTQTTADSYSLDLTTVTLAEGSYELRLVAGGSGIQDTGSELLATDASDTWLMDTTVPTADIDDVTPDPRNTAVGSVAINFSEPVTGVNLNDFTLTRNGTNVTLTGVTLTGSGASYSLNLNSVTAATGNYVLTLVAAGSGIVDVGGNPLAANVTDTWVNESTAPTADIVDVTPDPRSTAVGNVTIQFSELVTGVTINDFQLTRNGAIVPTSGLTVSGSGATYTIDLSAVTAGRGNYTLTLIAAGSGITDAAGNPMTANASDSWTNDDLIEQQNDTLRTATELGRINRRVDLGPLALVDANDWYRFTTVRAGKGADFVQIAFENDDGNLDLELYNVSGQRVRTSLTNGDTETVSLNGLKAGTYYIRVFGKLGATNTNYSLTVNMQAPATTKVARRPNTTVPIARSTIATDEFFTEVGTSTNPRTKFVFSR
jgi:hypothetical protein